MNAKPSSRKQHETNDPVDLYARDHEDHPNSRNVGSGELIMTTKLGAQGGFALLWFVLGIIYESAET